MRALLDFFFPPHCPVCRRWFADSDELNDRIVCRECDPAFSLRRRDALLSAAGDGSMCDLCGEPLGSGFEGDHRCLACQLDPLPLRLRSLYRYVPEVEAIVKALKYGRERALARYAADLLSAARRARAADDAFFRTTWNAVVAVPSSLDSLLRREFGHVHAIAARLARMEKIRFERFALLSSRPRQAQALLKPEDRPKNMRAAFWCDASRVEGRRILLIDDVVTTGASLCEAARSLMRAGAASVDAITIARSWRFARYAVEVRSSFGGRKPGRRRSESDPVERELLPAGNQRLFTLEDRV